MTTVAIQRYGQLFYEHLLDSHSPDQDVRRQIILNVLLCGMLLACLTAGLFAFIDQLDVDDLHQGNYFFNSLLLGGVTLSLWWLSLTGRYLLSAYIFLSCLSATAVSLVLGWSFELPSAELSCALLVVIAGLVLKVRSALGVSAVTIVCLLLIAHAQIFDGLATNTSWLKAPLELSDAFDSALILSVITLVSCLANLEIDRSLRHARLTELDLAAERDSLETRVTERTRELEQTQLTRLLELQRLAEFGRVSAHLVHEVANPLTAASLHLEHLGQRQSQSLRQARKNLHQLERYIEAARKQLQSQSQTVLFASGPELRQILSVVRPLAQKAGIQLVVEAPEPAKLLGDPVCFNQIVANLVVNAIDAYADLERPDPKRRIVVTLYPDDGYLHLIVRDWGKGIAAKQLSQLFEPFYTTKPANARGLGLGLSIVKQSVENDFDGHIRVTSSSNRGTAFHVKLRLATRGAPRQCRAVPAKSLPALARG